jgi:inactivated superfamily I helicase
MGVLESRVLDFDTVIVTSMNESFLPENLRIRLFRMM